MDRDPGESVVLGNRHCLERRIAHAAGALLAVDSTAATPVPTQPLARGADLVMHSATKYLNGHGDVIAGTLTTAREDAFWARLSAARSSGGAILGGFEAYLLLRGMRTLFRGSSGPAARRGRSPRRCSLPECRRCFTRGCLGIQGTPSRRAR